MRYVKSVRSSVPLPPTAHGRSGFGPDTRQNPVRKEPPRRPDWLMVLIGGLLLLTLLIAWLTDMPIR